MTKGSDLLVAALEREGVDRIFGVPGEENLDVVESLRTSSIELVLTRHEQAAAFMAATHGRLTGRPGVCIATLGPGALNFSTGAAYAHLGAMPMILITGQKPIMTARQARFQIVDVIASMKPLTKMTRQIVSAASIPAIVREAFRVAMEERPGPVHLELPEDVAGEEIEPVPLIPAAPGRHPGRPPGGARPGGRDDPGRQAAAHHARRRRKPPALARGSVGLRAAHAHSVLQHPDGQGHGRRAGPTSTWAPPRSPSATTSIEAIDRADLIIAIGHDTIEKPPFIMGEGGPQVIHVGYTPGQRRAGLLPARRGHRRCRPSLDAACRPARGQAANPASRLLALRPGILSASRIVPTEDRFPLTPQRIVHDVRQVMPERRDRVPRQRHVQDLVRPQLPHLRRQHAAARQRARHDGRGPALGHDGEAALSASGASWPCAAMAGS